MHRTAWYLLWPMGAVKTIKMLREWRTYGKLCTQVEMTENSPFPKGRFDRRVQEGGWGEIKRDEKGGEMRV